MRRHGLARGRALIACAVLALAVLASGCGPTAATSTVSGKTLTIWISAPPAGQADSRTQDVLDAEQLAFQQLGKLSGFTLRTRVTRAARISDNARAAIEDSTAIAYLGEIEPGQSAQSLGIVNGEPILQVSPTDTAVELTQATSAVSGAPGIYYEQTGSNIHTFARVVPTTKLEARALLQAASGVGASKLFVATDGQPYGAALAAAVAADAQPAGVTVVQGAPTAAAFASSGATALLFAGADAKAATTLFDSVAGANGSAHLLAPSALADDGFVSGLSPAAQSALQVTEPGFLPANLTAGGQQFASAFTSAYGHQPDPQAIFGYEAMAAVIAALKQAGTNAANRATVIHDFFALHNRASVLGTYSIDSDGDTSLAPFVISRTRSGRLTPYRFVSAQG